jgi:hypothetical protein
MEQLNNPDGRVLAINLAILGDGTELEVCLTGAVYHAAQTDAELPSVGDWVGFSFTWYGCQQMARPVDV